MRRKRDVRSFSNDSKKVLLALLVVGAAFAVYGIANAAIVSHRGEEVIGSVSTSDDSSRLQGLAAADILAQSGGGSGSILVTWGFKQNTHSAYKQSYTYCPNSQASVPQISAGESAPACPSGWTEVYAGWGPHSYMNEVISPSSQSNYGYGVAAAIEICTGSRSYSLPSTKPGSITGACSEWENIPSYGASGTCYFYKSCNTCRVCLKG